MSDAPDARPAVINIEDVPEAGHAPGGDFQASWRSLTNALAMEKLGARLNTVPPGKTAWPFHRHFANEELVIVVSGAGALRLGAETKPVRAGDCMAFPAGGLAHQLRNTGDEPLVYWSVSTQITPDVCEYPDSAKFGVIAGGAAPGKAGARQLAAWVPLDAKVDYWADET